MAGVKGLMRVGGATWSSRTSDLQVGRWSHDGGVGPYSGETHMTHNPPAVVVESWWEVGILTWGLWTGHAELRQQGGEVTTREDVQVIWSSSSGEGVIVSGACYLHS